MAPSDKWFGGTWEEIFQVAFEVTQWTRSGADNEAIKFEGNGNMLEVRVEMLAQFLAFSFALLSV